MEQIAGVRSVSLIGKLNPVQEHAVPSLVRGPLEREGGEGRGREGDGGREGKEERERGREGERAREGEMEGKEESSSIYINIYIYVVRKIWICAIHGLPCANHKSVLCAGNPWIALS